IQPANIRIFQSGALHETAQYVTRDPHIGISRSSSHFFVIGGGRRPAPALAGLARRCSNPWQRPRKSIGGVHVMLRRSAVLSLLAVLCLAATARAEDYPSRTIKILTTSSAGGLSDIFTRVLADRLRARLNQTIVIENKPGAAGNIAIAACGAAKPDGYTFCVVEGDAIFYNRYLTRQLTYDPDTALTPVTGLFSIIQALVVNSDLKVQSVGDLVALSKAKKGTLS